MRMNVYDFLNQLENVLLKQQTEYKLGYFMNKSIDSHYLCDCSGMIKAVFWGYPYGDRKYENGFPDISADQMISKCSNVSSDFKNIVCGELVWTNGHIGVYLRDGVVIECTPKWKNGVQMTFLDNGRNANMYGLPTRKWKKHGYFNYIDYSNKQYNQNTADGFLKLINDIIQGRYGNGQERINKLKNCGFNDAEIESIQKCVNESMKWYNNK